MISSSRSQIRRLFAGAMIVVVAALLCAASFKAFAQDAPHPFSRGGEQGVSKGEPAAGSVTGEASFLARIYRFSTAFQKEIRERMTEFAREMKNEPFGRSCALFLFFAFLYGVVHAIGPGHGKSVVASYFFCRPGGLSHALLMANMVTFIHVLSGALVVAVLAIIFPAVRQTQFDMVVPPIARISYSLMIAVGAYLLVISLRTVRRKEPEEEGIPPGRGSLSHLFATAIVAGLIPCPGAALILMFSMLLGILPQGILAMLFIALGMGVTTSAVAVASILFKGFALSLARGSSNSFTFVYAGFELLGALMIMAFGSLMLIGSF